MKKYEIMAIIVNNIDEKAAKKVAEDSLKKRIKEFGGATTFEDFWGAKGFAYKIEGEKWGYYVVYQFDIDGTKLTELERELNIDNSIVRFLITKVEKHMPEPTKYADMKIKDIKIEKIEEENTKEKEIKKVLPAAEKKEEEKKDISKDEVDKKLDQILDDASIGL